MVCILQSHRERVHSRRSGFFGCDIYYYLGIPKGNSKTFDDRHPIIHIIFSLQTYI